MNLSMLSSTIQGMEVQRSTINTLRAAVDSAASMDLGALRDSGAASPLEVVLGLKPAPGKAKAAAPSGDAARDGGKGPAQDHAGDAAPAEAAAQDAAPPFAGMSEQMGAAAGRRQGLVGPAAATIRPDRRRHRRDHAGRRAVKVESEADKPAPKAAKTEAKPAAKAPGNRPRGRRPRQARRPQGSAQDGAVRLAPAP